MQYILSPRCKTPTGVALALSAATEGTVTVQLASDLRDNIVWTLVYSMKLNGFVLYNNAVGKVLNVKSDDKTLNLVDLNDSLPQTAAWNAAGGNESLALRPMSNFDLNLNVFGGGPSYPAGNQVGVWAWGGGQPNETWLFQQVGSAAPYGWFHRLDPVCKDPNGNALALSLNGRDDYGNIVVTTEDSADDRQLWTPIYYFGGGINGAAFVNKETGRALASTGNDALVYTVSLNNLNGSSLWTLGGSAPYALRPQNNSNMNLNVLGGGPYPSGNNVGIWSWGGGQPNEKWNATLVDSSLEEDDLIVSSEDGYYFCVLSGTKDPNVCTVPTQAGSTDLVFRLSKLQSNQGVGFTVTDPDGTVYSTESRGQNDVWALPAQDGSLGLQAFYVTNPKSGVWTANVKKSAAAKRDWEIVGSTNTATSGISAAGAFSNLSPGKQQAIYDLLVPRESAFDPVPPEFCYFCIAQGYVIGALMIATFVFWAGPVIATSAIVLYTQRLLGANAAKLVGTFNTLYTAWNQGGPNSTTYSLIRKLCELEGFCKKS